MRYYIEKGDKFKCIKTYKMEDGEVAYIKGKIYLSELKDCITDEQLDVNHYMDNLVEFFEHLKLEI